MTYRDKQRLTDIASAIAAIRSHLARGDISDGLIFDAVRIRLLEIGEAVKALPAEFLSGAPDIPWKQVAGMRNHLAHRYSIRATRFSARRSITTCQVVSHVYPVCTEKGVQ